MPRAKLPNRRLAVTAEVEWINFVNQSEFFEITFGIIEKTANKPTDRFFIMEVFASGKTTDRTELINDACILMSKLLQHGDDIYGLVNSLGERYSESSASGTTPASLIGAIAKTGASLQREMNQEPPPKPSRDPEPPDPVPSPPQGTGPTGDSDSMALDHSPEQ